MDIVALVAGSAAIITGSAVLWDAIKHTEFGPNGPIRSSYQYSSMAFVFTMLVAWFHWFAGREGAYLVWLDIVVPCD